MERIWAAEGQTYLHAQGGKYGGVCARPVVRGGNKSAVIRTHDPRNISVPVPQSPRSGARAPKSMVIRPREEAHRVDSPERRELGTDFPPEEIEKTASGGGGRRCGERWI